MVARQRSPQVLLLSSRFQYAKRRLLFTKARLYLDRIELSGWDFAEKHRQEIPLAQLTKVEWHPEDASEPDVVLHLDTGETVSLSLPEADRWKRSLEERLRWSAPDRRAVSSTLLSGDVPLYDHVLFSTTLG